MKRVNLRRLARLRGGGEDAATETPASACEGPVEASAIAQWTGGTRLATKAATVLLIGALFAGVPALAIALLAFAAAGPSAAPIQQAGARDDQGRQVVVEEYAARFVTAWVEATDATPGELEQFLNVSTMRLPREAAVASNVDVAAVDQVEPGQWSVTVGVTVISPKAGAVRRYYRVPLLHSDQGTTSLSVPVPAAAPESLERPGLAYGEPVLPTDAAYDTVAGFLTAYLTGSADAGRYVSPGAEDVVSIEPPPYKALEILEIRALTTPVLAPADGDRLRVIADAEGRTGVGTQLVQYPLTLTARDGRWEISVLDELPAVATSSTPEPSATNTTSGSPEPSNP